MCWCRIKLVLLGLLGLLCVVHVVSGMCGQDFPSTVMVADVVVQGKVKAVTDTDRNTRLYNATITIRNPVLKGKKILKKGMSGKTLTLGPFTRRPDNANCVGPVKRGKTYIFLLKKGSKNEGVKFVLQALPKKRTKKEYKKLKDMLCKATNTCKSKKAVKPKIKRVVGPKNTVRTGSKLTFRCHAKAKPPPVYTWYKDGVLLKPRRGLIITSNKRYSKLQVRKAKISDQGDYKCVVKNAVGTDMRNLSSFAIRNNPKTYRGDTLCELQTRCLNGGTCLHNEKLDVKYCLCKPKWTGSRCEIMDGIRIHGQYSRQATLLYERTLIIVGLVIAVLVFIAICIASYFLAKRRRKKFEAKKKRKQLREKTSNPACVKGNQAYHYQTDENFPLGYNKLYQNVNNDTRSFLPTRDNGFDLEAAQRQPLLRPHGHDDVDGSGPESRRRLKASSIYDNFDDPTNQNRSANVTGLTTAEVTQNSEMIEMNPMERHGIATALDDSNPRARTEEGYPYPPSEDSSLPLSQSSPLSTQPPISSSPTESHQPPEPLTTTPGDLDFEKYKAPPPPILPLSHSNSSPLRHIPNSSAAAAAVAAVPSRFPSSNSMPSKLVNNIDSNTSRPGGHNSNHPSLPYNHNNSNNNSSNNDNSNNNNNNNNNSPASNVRGKHQHPLTMSQNDSPPSYDTAVVLMNGITSDVDSDFDEGNIPHRFRDNQSNAIEDLHISEDDLGLSSENLPRGSFNSSTRPSFDLDGADDMCNRRRKFSVDKQQSEDIQPVPFFKYPYLYGQSPRSLSLDIPDKVNGTGPNHLDSTVAENQNTNHENSSGSKYHHADDVFDPNDDSSPWDPEQACNSNYANLLDKENDRLNRLKDVCPDQSAIPI